MDVIQKITVQLPAALVKRARKSSGLGITATIKQGLELVSARLAYEGLRRLRGKVKFSIHLKKLRQDRS